MDALIEELIFEIIFETVKDGIKEAVIDDGIKNNITYTCLDKELTSEIKFEYEKLMLTLDIGSFKI